MHNLRLLLLDLFPPSFYSKGHKIGLDSGEHACATGAVNHRTGEDGHASVCVCVYEEASEMTSRTEMTVINWSEVSFSSQGVDQLPVSLPRHRNDTLNENILRLVATTEEKQIECESRAVNST